MWNKAAVAVSSFFLLSCQMAADRPLPSSGLVDAGWRGETAGMPAEVELRGSLYRTSETSWLSVRSGARLQATAEGAWCGAPQEPRIDTNGTLVCFYDSGAGSFDRIVIMSQSAPLTEFRLQHGIPFAQVNDLPPTWPTVHTQVSAN